jgi:hypothetical protein
MTDWNHGNCHTTRLPLSSRAYCCDCGGKIAEMPVVIGEKTTTYRWYCLKCASEIGPQWICTGWYEPARAVHLPGMKPWGLRGDDEIFAGTIRLLHEDGGYWPALRSRVRALILLSRKKLKQVFDESV